MLASNLASARESLACVLCTHASTKGVNCTACCSGIACVSQFASARSIVTSHKIAYASKLIVLLILLIRSFAISTLWKFAVLC